MTSKRVTSIDVARLARVSQSAVSRTFSAGGVVSAETRARVLAAAEQLGYTPNALARSMITRRTNIIGVVMADMINPFYPTVLEELSRQLNAAGRQMLLLTATPDQDSDALLPLLLQYQVDAVIIASATISSAMAGELAARGTPVVLFNRHVPGAPASAVLCDNVAGGRQVARVLLDAGHARLGFIAGKPNTSTTIDRAQGFAAQLHERGITAWQQEQGTYTYESGYVAAVRLLARPKRPTAIFCANDIMALGAIDAARTVHRLHVPDDVSIIGFDDIPAAAWPAYALTTVQQPVQRMVSTTIELLQARLDQPDAPPEVRLLPGELIRRGSARLESKVQKH
jgi:DNA-binding LacI/PurR family transcriptional regulator